MKLYYNAEHPLEILSSLTIKISKVTRDRGVSMSVKPLNCHGAFTFAFKEYRMWYRQFQAVQYGDWEQIDFTHKQKMFEDEHEYWSEKPVSFVLDDIDYILFRSKSAAARIHPRITVRNFNTLSQNYRHLVRKV